MSDDIPPTRWRYWAGVVNCLTGGVFAVLSIACTVGAVGAIVTRDTDALAAVLWTLFTGGIGASLLWIGVGDLRSRRRPTWIVRIALYICVVAILTPMLFIAREANRKRQVINNLNQLRVAIEQYESTFKTRPPGAASVTTEPDPNK